MTTIERVLEKIQQMKLNSKSQAVFLTKEERNVLRGYKENSAHISSPDLSKSVKSAKNEAKAKPKTKKKNTNKRQHIEIAEQSLISAESHLKKLDLIREDQIEPEFNYTKEIEQIRKHYLGIKTEKKKIQKPSEKFRNIFNFEWDSSEDTGRGDINPLYQNRLEPQLLFGRGFRAGIDIREQRKRNNFYDDLIRKRVQVDKGGGLAEIPLVREKKIFPADGEENHWSAKNVADMTERDWRIFREDYEIYIKGSRIPAPARSWEETGLPEELLKSVSQANYTIPTPIQMQSIPLALQMRDIVGVAQTGSGKTAAFVLPMLTYVKGLPALNDITAQDGPYGLILAPSRELALQIEEEVKKFSSFFQCRTVAVVGGRNAESQAFRLRLGTEVVVGTPGRIRDSLEKTYTVLNQCNYVVLDEADRMIDLGFEETVNWILDQIPSTNMKSLNEDEAILEELQAKAGFRHYRITHMFSATMPAPVEALARKYLRAPVWLSVGDPGVGKRSIEQVVEFVTEGKKRARLEEVLREIAPPVMIFVNQKKLADALSKGLNKAGFSAVALHGGKAQDTRENSLQWFKTGEVDILVATDVAGRGIDVEGVTLVLNYDMPRDIDSYTHRIGRTGRAGNKGLAISFVTEEDNVLFYDLKQYLASTNNIIPLELANHPNTKIKPGGITAETKPKPIPTYF